jgi:predicted metal-dependent RNase
MKIRFLGGAGEVGASCILVSTESGKNILLDAGVRVSEEGTEMLPNLEPLNDIVLDAIIVSHAHLDHSGNRMRAAPSKALRVPLRRLFTSLTPSFSQSCP